VNHHPLTNQTWDSTEIEPTPQQSAQKCVNDHLRHTTDYYHHIALQIDTTPFNKNSILPNPSPEQIILNDHTRYALSHLQRLTYNVSPSLTTTELNSYKIEILDHLYYIEDLIHNFDSTEQTWPPQQLPTGNSITYNMGVDTSFPFHVIY
jgi:hypothetical protein